MRQDKLCEKFPDTYPSDLLERIIEDGAAANTMEDVYRVANYGSNNRDAFLSTFLQNIKDGKYNDRDSVLALELSKNDIGEYATSLSTSEKRAVKLLQIMERHYAGPILLKGTIYPEYGLSMLTRYSKSNRISNKFHVDWWVYAGADPSCHFNVIELKEE